MILKPAGQSLNITVPDRYVFIRVNVNQDNWGLAVYFNDTGSSFTVNLNESFNTRYYMTPNVVQSASPLIYFLNDQNQNVFRVYDVIKNDTSATQVVGYNAFIDFLWLTN